MSELNQNLRNKELLEPKFMLSMYIQGAFPMAEDNGEINWYLPEKRAIILVKEFSVPRSLKTFMKTSNFNYKYDFNIVDVIKECAARERTWISEELIGAYKRLIDYGYLHSVEVYKNKKLIGGLFGVTFRGVFFGESMFSNTTQASKTALVKLFERLRVKKFKLVDVQFMTEHLAMFGTKEVDFEDYEHMLLDAYQDEITF